MVKYNFYIFFLEIYEITTSFNWFKSFCECPGIYSLKIFTTITLTIVSASDIKVCRGFVLRFPLLFAENRKENMKLSFHVENLTQEPQFADVLQNKS